MSEDHGHKDMYEMYEMNDCDYREMDDMIDEYRGEYSCNCGTNFTYNEAVEGDSNDIVSCPACGEEHELREEG